MTSVWFAIVVLAVGLASWRAAWPLSPTIGFRVLVASVLFCGFGVLSSMVLGLGHWGGNELVLGVVALAAAGVVGLTVPKGTGPTLLGWYQSLDPRARAIAGGLVGLFIAIVVWDTLHPLVGFDGIGYHLAESLHWVKHGDPGSSYEVSIINPYGSFPLVDEIFNGWLLALGRGFAPAMIWPVAAGGLLGVGSWTGLRNWGVGKLPAALGAAAAVASPLMVGSLLGPGTDMSSLAWLAAGAAMLGATRSHPRLSGPALLAIGLAIGTKTTVLPYAAALVVVWLVTRPWSRLAGQRLLAIGLGAAGAIIGGLCYVRNLGVHGSPLWPTTVVPWGDPRPPGFFGLYATFAGHIRGTLAGGNATAYRGYLSGDLLLFAGGLLVIVACRRRLPVAFGVATLAGLLLFAIAPTTGIPPGTAPVLAAIHVISIRYVLPAMLPAIVAIAFAAEVGWRWLWCGLLAAAALWSLEFDLTSKLVYRPVVWVMVLGIAGGAALAMAAPGALRRIPATGGGLRIVAMAVAAGVLVVGLAGFELVGSRGFLVHHSQFSQPDSPLISVLPSIPQVPDSGTVAMSPIMDALVSGVHLTRDVEFIGSSETCTQIRHRLLTETIIVTPAFGIEQLQTLRDQVVGCLRGVPTVYNHGNFTIYAKGASAA